MCWPGEGEGTLHGYHRSIWRVLFCDLEQQLRDAKASKLREGLVLLRKSVENDEAAKKAELRKERGTISAGRREIRNTAQPSNTSNKCCEVKMQICGYREVEMQKS